MWRAVRQKPPGIKGLARPTSLGNDSVDYRKGKVRARQLVSPFEPGQSLGRVVLHRVVVPGEVEDRGDVFVVVFQGLPQGLLGLLESRDPGSRSELDAATAEDQLARSQGPAPLDP